MKKVLLLSLLSFGINASIAVLDLRKIEKEVNSAIFVNEKDQQAFWVKDWAMDVKEWSEENRFLLVLGNDPNYSYDQQIPCLYFSSSIDVTEEFISWLKKKYLSGP